MTDLTTLHDAFAELEQRADAEARAGLPRAGRPVRPATRVRSPRRRPVLIGVTAAALVAAVGGAAVFADRSEGSGRPPAVAAGGPGATSPSSAPATPSAPTTPSAQATPTAQANPYSGSSPGTPTSTPGLPTSTDALRARFQAVLGDLATFEVTSTNDPSASATPSATGTPGAPGEPQLPVPSPASATAAPDVAIIGLLTAAGATGGFDVQTLQTDPGAAAWCATDTPCTVTTLADGSSLAIGVDTLLAADGSPDGGTLLVANLIHPDGTEILLHVSNQRDPKGMSDVLAPQPPLTTAQMTTVVTSPRWLTG